MTHSQCMKRSQYVFANYGNLNVIFGFVVSGGNIVLIGFVEIGPIV